MLTIWVFHHIDQPANSAKLQMECPKSSMNSWWWSHSYMISFRNFVLLSPLLLERVKSCEAFERVFDPQQKREAGPEEEFSRWHVCRVRGTKAAEDRGGEETEEPTVFTLNSNGNGKYCSVSQQDFQPELRWLSILFVIFLCRLCRWRMHLSNSICT